MTGYEKIMNVIDGEIIKPVPTMLHSFMTAASEKGLSQAEYRNSAENIANSHIDFARKYGLDGVLIDIDTCMEAGAVGVPVDLPENEPARVLQGLDGGIDACIDAMEKDSLLKYDRIKIYLESINILSQKVKGELLIRGNADQGPFSLAMLSLGISEFMMNLVDPDMNEKTKLLIDRALDVHLEYHKLIIEAGADITSLGDSSCGPDLISRDMYLEYSFPYQKRLADELKKMKIKSVLHICGNLDNILEDVVKTGFPAIEVDYKTNMERAQKIMKNKAVLFGPIDPSGGFYFSNASELADVTHNILEMFKGEGIVIGAGCALPPGVPEINIRSFMDQVSNYV